MASSSSATLLDGRRKEVRKPEMHELRQVVSSSIASIGTGEMERIKSHKQFATLEAPDILRRDGLIWHQALLCSHSSEDQDDVHER